MQKAEGPQTAESQVERSEAEKAAAWDALVKAAGTKLASSRTMPRDKWQLWASRWVESGGQIEDARTVGRWIAHGGLDWLQRRSKTDHLAQSWADCLGKALDSPQIRAERATAAAVLGSVFPAGKGAETIPDECLGELRRLGLGGGAKS